MTDDEKLVAYLREEGEDEAAAIVVAQAERIEKLEAALERIAALRLRGMETEAQRIARAALQANPKDER